MPLERYSNLNEKTIKIKKSLLQNNIPISIIHKTFVEQKTRDRKPEVIPTKIIQMILFFE